MASNEYPKWVLLHERQVRRIGNDVFSPGFERIHLNRATGDVIALVHDAQEEARATGAETET